MPTARREKGRRSAISLLARVGAMVVLVLLACHPSTAAAADGSIASRSDLPPSVRNRLPEGEAPPPGTEVDEIRVLGNRRVAAESIRNRIDVRAGDGFDPAQISEDIHDVYDLGYFEDVAVDAVRTPAGEVVVTFIVREKPAVSEIVFEGNKELKDEKLKKALTFEAHEILDRSAVETSADKVRQKYVDKGYYLADVQSSIETVDEGRGLVRVTFSVQEYERVQVKRIDILGNEAISDKRIQRVLKTKEGNVVSLISPKVASFKKETFKTDIQKITLFYYKKGYVEVNVDVPSIRISDDKRFLYITVRVDEGLQYSVGNIDVEGQLLLERQKLLEMVSLEKGEIFDWGKMRQDMERMRRAYRDRGYAKAQVRPLTKMNREEQTVDLTFEFKKGKKYRIGRIEIAGNDKTRDRVIRRELEIAEGEVYSQSDIDASKRAIKRLGFFKKVKVSTTDSSREGYIDVEFSVTERRTGNFQVGAGFSSTESFIFNARVSQNNLFGRGQSLSLQTQISAIRTMIDLRFTEPWLFGTRWEFSASAYNFEYVLQDFTQRRRGGSVTLGYPISDLFDWDLRGYLTVRGTYKLEDVNIESGGRRRRGGRRPGSVFEDGLTSSVAGEVELDTRDNRLFPTKGHFHKATAEIADDQYTFSDTQFAKFDWESRVYVPLVWEFVLRLNGQIGYVANIESDQPVPLSERYFVGGPQSVRGFERVTLGPARQVAARRADPATSLTDFNIGGNKQALFTAEVEFPILRSVGLKGVVFADAGNAFGDRQPLSLKLDLFDDRSDGYSDVLRTSTGFGVRWRSPMGPLRFEWGFPLQPLPEDKPVVFHFSMGSGF
ncbi:MAG: outer membrane protein assembly factor BamA [Bradymonadaceae bacterium]